MENSGLCVEDTMQRMSGNPAEVPVLVVWELK